MSNKLPPRVQFDFVDDEIPENEPPSEHTLAVNLDSSPTTTLCSKEEEEVSDDEEMYINNKIPKFIGKPKPVKEEIFDLPNLAVMPDEVKENLKFEGMEEEINYLEDSPTPTPPAPKPRKSHGAPKMPPQAMQKKPRKPMSEEHKQKLAVAREKAMLVRKQKAEEKKKMKELENQEKELLKQQKVKRVQKLKEEVEQTAGEAAPVRQPQIKSPNVGVTTFTKKDLEDAQFDAIVKYDKLRKLRKEEKRKQEAIEKSKQELMNKLKPQEYRYRDGSNVWDKFY